MSRYTIAVVVGSLRRDSINRKLADAVARLGPPDFTFRNISIGDLPLFNQDEEMNPGEPVRRLKAEIEAAQGLLFVTPEYSRSIPGVLKNALDHGARPFGCADARPAGGFHPRQRGIFRRGRQYRSRQQAVSAEMDGPLCGVGKKTCGLTERKSFIEL